MNHLLNLLRVVVVYSSVVWFYSTAQSLITYRGVNFPWGDDWDAIPAMAGVEKDIPSWLWSQHNEHRVPLPRAIILLVTGYHNGDVRCVMHVNFYLMLFLSVVGIATARY